MMIRSMAWRYWKGQNPDLLMLRVRLPLKQRDLAPVIIQQLLLRERSDTR